MTRVQGSWESRRTDLAAYLSWVHDVFRKKRLLQQAWGAFVVLKILLAVASWPRLEPWPIWTVLLAPFVAIALAMAGRFVADRVESHRIARRWSLGPQAITLAGTGAVLVTPAATFSLPWDEVTYLVDAPDHLLITAESAALWVPKRAFPSEQWPEIWNALEGWNAAARERRAASPVSNRGHS